MSDPFHDDDPPWKQFVGWWRGMTTIEKFASVAVVATCVASGITWPLAPVLQFRGLGWIGFVSVTAGFLGVSLLGIKVLGQLTGADDIRWKNVFWWDVLLLITLAQNVYLFVEITAAI